MSQSSSTTASPRPVERVFAPLRNFLDTEASGGILLLAAAMAALVWANSPLSPSYDALWHTEVVIEVGEFRVAEDLHFWINDGLMAIFFFVVGLEIKRELVSGELTSVRRALLPVAGALGGAVLPAAIFVAVTRGGEGSDGWGVPMATDIAFALGILALLGSRVPIGLKIFVTALAIADDLIAIVIIAIFYSGNLSLPAVGAAAGVLALLIAGNWLHVRSYLFYAGLGIALWMAVLASGVHATIAGVLLALTVPARTAIDGHSFVLRARELIDAFEDADHPEDVRRSETRQSALSDLEDATEAIQTPLQRLEHSLHPWVAYFIVPLFALSNAGVALGTGVTEALGSSVAYGIIAGLVVGKQVGILAAAWLVVRVGWADLPAGVSWRQVWGAGCVAGIGFTMSLFIGELAYADTPALLDVAKVAILTASVLAASIAWLVLRSAVPSFASTAAQPEPIASGPHPSD